MPTERPYSRVYWEILDDPKFETILPDVGHMGAWLKLLVSADMAHPSPAYLPPVPKRSLQALTAVGLVDLLSGGRYRLRGLAAERSRRTAAASVGAMRRWSGRNANALPSESERNAVGMPRRGIDEDETRRDEAGDAPDLTQAVDLIEKLSGRPFSHRPGSKVWDTLTADLRDFGLAQVTVAMNAVTDPHPDVAQLVFGASRRLHPLSTPNGTAPKGHQVTAQEADRAFR